MFDWLLRSAAAVARKVISSTDYRQVSGWNQTRKQKLEPRQWTNNVIKLVDPSRVYAAEAKGVKLDIESKLKSAESRKDALLMQTLNAELAAVQAKEKGYQEEATKRERVLFALSCVGATISLVLYWDDTLSRFRLVAIFRILRSNIKEHDSSLYVPRDLDLDLQLGVPQPWYDIVLGPKGSGKTTLIRHALSGARGVTLLSVAEQDKNVYPRIAEAFNIRSSHYRLDDHYQLTDLLKSASWWAALINRLFYRSDAKWVPTIVVELDHQTDFSNVSTITNQLKHLAIDDECARVILVLSDSSLQYALPKDPIRQRTKWVGDMQVEEALLMFQRRNLQLSEQDTQLIIQKIGTRPGDLRRLMGEIQVGGHLVSSEIEKALDWAKDEMLAMLHFEESVANTNKIKFRSILSALLAHPTGVPISQFEGSTAVPMLFGPSFKQFSSIMYYPSARRFEFSSPLHHEAAKCLSNRLQTLNVA